MIIKTTGNLLCFLQNVLFCILIGYNCIFQGHCTLISNSTDEPEATKANVHITKAKHLSQPCIIQVWFPQKHCLGQIVCASLIVRTQVSLQRGDSANLQYESLMQVYCTHSYTINFIKNKIIEYEPFKRFFLSWHPEPPKPLWCLSILTVLDLIIILYYIN